MDWKTLYSGLCRAKDYVLDALECEQLPKTVHLKEYEQTADPISALRMRKYVKQGFVRNLDKSPEPDTTSLDPDLVSRVVGACEDKEGTLRAIELHRDIRRGLIDPTEVSYA